MEKEQLDYDRIFVIPSFLSPQECERFINLGEEKGFGDAPITTAAGFVMRKDIRNNDRAMVDDPALAGELFERARPFLVQEFRGWDLVGFNERWRYYRYDPGQTFAPHRDGAYERENGERSRFTFMIYLNDGYEGGETIFHEGREVLRVKPERGKVLVFHHPLLHEGAPVVAGRKYVLRTDIMYRKRMTPAAE